MFRLQFAIRLPDKSGNNIFRLFFYKASTPMGCAGFCNIIAFECKLESQ